MPILRVQNREFQRSAGRWLKKAREGNIIVIESSRSGPLTLHPGSPPTPSKYDWDEHWAWLKKQPVREENPADELRRYENR